MLPTADQPPDTRTMQRRRDLIRAGLRFLAAAAVGAPAQTALAQANGTAAAPANQPDATGLSFTHVSISVRELDRSVRFYCDALGFEKLNDPRPPATGVGKLVGIDGDVRFWLQHLRRQEIRLQLMKFDAPTPIGDGQARPMNTLGFTHFSFRVREIEPALAAIRRAGGTVLEDSRTSLSTSVVVFCLDPDGNRIELSTPPTPRKS